MNRDDPRLAPTRDHIIPESKGGRETLIACYTCNTIKGDMMPEVWAAFMETFPRWWTLSKEALRRARRESFFTPGYKPPKSMRRAAAREAERTAKWGPRMSREERERVQAEMGSRQCRRIRPAAAI